MKICYLAEFGKTTKYLIPENFRLYGMWSQALSDVVSIKIFLGSMPPKPSIAYYNPAPLLWKTPVLIPDYSFYTHMQITAYLNNEYEMPFEIQESHVIKFLAYCLETQLDPEKTEGTTR